MIDARRAPHSVSLRDQPQKLYACGKTRAVPSTNMAYRPHAMPLRQRLSISAWSVNLMTVTAWVTELALTVTAGIRSAHSLQGTPVRVDTAAACMEGVVR
jgi:hypothetical protein